jgi:hypothetical protein
VRASVALLLLAALSACGGSGSSPSDTSPHLTAIAPASGTTLGGTPVTITGTNLSGTPSVALGGVAATSVNTTSSTTITATTGAHAAGAVDVVVTVNGRTATLPGGFTYVAPPVTANTPPVIQSIVARGTRPNEPQSFADLSEQIGVTATVTDAETPVASLQFEWKADAGALSGAGTSVQWQAPAAFDAPGAATITLTVTENYQTTDPSTGLPVPATNVVSANVVVHVHDSAREVGGLARQFLLDFADSSLSPQYVMRNFTPSCPGTSEELQQVTHNRDTYKITSSATGNATTTVNFGGRCPRGGVVGDACSDVPVSWTSTVIADGKTRTDTGTDELTAVYESDAWKLCDSTFDGSCTGAGCVDNLRRFVRFLK